MLISICHHIISWKSCFWGRRTTTTLQKQHSRCFLLQTSYQKSWTSATLCWSRWQNSNEYFWYWRQLIPDFCAVWDWDSYSPLAYLDIWPKSAAPGIIKHHHSGAEGSALLLDYQVGVSPVFRLMQEVIVQKSLCQKKTKPGIKQRKADRHDHQSSEEPAGRTASEVTAPMRNWKFLKQRKTTQKKYSKDIYKCAEVIYL